MSEDLRGIAIIGLAGRFPGARDAEELWHNLRAGVESVTFFSPEELRAAGIDPAETARPGYVPARALLDGIEDFDADFFGFTPREAELTDPQQRLFLEHAWTALENAGYDPHRYPGPIGVFGGAGLNSYLLLHLWPRINMGDVAGSLQASIHNKNDHLTTRVAYELGLRGPAVSVQTACSTSLVATALACQSLLHYQCDMALAGGVTVTLPQRAGYTYQEGGIASPDGHCRAFDARAQGTVDGSGVGLVVLKRLEDAVADGDTILAVIKGAALNNDGAGRAGYTAPGLDSQAEVIATAHALAGVEADSVTYVEAHGTGTPLGDPIEIAALTQAFRLTTERRGFCAVGSVKTNFGHLDAAAGVAGLIKTALALKHREIPPSLHFERPNPRIDFENSPFFVNAQLREWPAGPEPRRAGVSSFGIGGTNAHLVLEEAPEVPAADPEPGWQLLVLSARTGSALEAATDNLARHLRDNPDTDLADLAWTLQEGRAVFEHRRALIAESAADAVAALESLDPDRVFQRVQPAGHRPVSFLFPGQGAQYAGMGAGLYEAEPVYRREVDRALGLLPRDLAAELRPLLTEGGGDDEALARTDLAQPALFVVEHALAKLWMEWGVRPHSFLGHSLGEYVAACLAGVMTLEEALALVAVRGRLVASLPGGAMLSVSLPEAELVPRLGDLALAAVNGPSLCVASGPVEAIDELERRLSAEGIVCRRLHTSHAFHSEVLDPILDTFEAEVRKVKLAPPAVPFLSNLTGTWITEAEATDPVYWVRHLRHTVRFADGVRELLQEPRAVLLEVGPGRTLKTAARWHTAKGPQQVVETSMRHPREAWADPAFLLGAAGRLWLAGVELDWKALHGGRRRKRVPLPTYPFERRRYWIEAPKGGRTAPAAVSLERKPDLGDWFYQPVWKETPSPTLSHGAGEGWGGGSWLLLAHPGGAAERLAGHLTRQGARVLLAAPGDDLAARLTELSESGPVRGIVHAWCAERDSSFDTQAADLGFHGLLGLARTLADHPAAAEGLEIVALTSDLQPVTGAEELRPERALLLGPVKVIPREDPRLRCRSLDASWTGVPPSSPKEDRILDRLAAEILVPASEVAVAYRGERRWVQDYTPVHLPASGAPSLRLREGGVYLITGGLGGVGLEIAELLAREARAKLVLTGRSAFPERDAWSAWISEHGEGDPTSRKIRRLERLESLGATVWTAAADVADREAVARLVAEVRGRFGAIHGAIHAAGVPDGGLIQLRTREASEAVLAAKVAGTRNLAEAVGTDLDFLALFSSLSGVVGRLGQVAYGAANAFLDAFAHDHMARTGVLTLSIDWGEWQGVGMASDEKDIKDVRDIRDGKDARDSQPGAHPFLEARREGPGGEVIFATPFSIERHWVLDEHRLMGHAVIPGVAYYEMVRAALAGERPEGATGNALRFSDVLFIAPVHVRDEDPREVRLHLIPEGPSSWRFAVRSQTDAEYLTGEKQGDMDFVTGRVAWVDAPRPPRRDLDEIRRRCNLRRAVWTEEDREDDLGPRWQNVKFADVGRSEVLTRLELGSDHAADFQVMKLHPSLLDRSAGVAKEYLVEGTYLPLSYGRLTVFAELPPRIYSHARYREDATSNFETLTFDTSVLDDAGNVIVEIENFSQKRVNDAAVKIRSASGGSETRLATVAPSEDAGDHRARQEMQAAEGAEAFRRVLAWAPGPQVAVSVRDLHAVLAEADRMGHERILEETEKRREARPAHPRPRLSTAYAPPRNDAEKTVAAAWADLLGLDQVGVHDNFFELGGDSVQALQIIASLRAAGLELTPQQFFQHQTVAELVAHATRGTGTPAVAPVETPLPALPAEELRRLDLPEEEIEDSYPLSPLQQGMLFHTLYAPGSGDYVEQVWWILEGDLDESAFAAAWREVVARQPALRTAFAWEDLPEPFQAVWRRAELPIRRLDWRQEWAGWSPKERYVRLAAWLQDDRRAGFEPSRPPLARLTELRLSENERRYVWTYHHALMDGWSAPLVLAEVSQIYEARVRGEEPRLEPVHPYRSFIAWLRAQDRAAAEAFWRREMAGFEPAEPLVMPAGVPGAEDRLSTERARLSAEAADRLRHLARRHQVTLNTLVQGAWALLLSRYGAGDDVVFGGVVAGRPTELPGIERWVGLFINTLPVRVRVPNVGGMAEPAVWLRDLQARQLAARGFEHTALADIRDWAGLPPDRPLFESILVFENLPDTGGPGEGDTSGRLALRDVARAPGRTGFPLTVEVFPGADLTVDVTGDGRFAPEAVSRMTRHLLHLLETLAEAAGTGRRLDSLSPLSEEERRQLLTDWNPVTRFPWNGPVHQAFEAWSARRPDAPAVVCGDEQVTYGELNRRAEELAASLRERGVGPETVVALLIPPSVDLIAAILGIWKAGGAYQPLDPESPPERWAWLREDGGSQLLLTTADLAQRLPELPDTGNLNVIRVNAGGAGAPSPAQRGRVGEGAVQPPNTPSPTLPHAGAWERAPSALPKTETGVGPDTLAYLLYTSGSTGRPKGVEVTHGNVARLFTATRSLGFGETDTWTLFHSAAFDFSVWEIWGALAHGGRLVVVPPGVSRDTEAFRGLLAREQVTVLSQTPSAFQALTRIEEAAASKLPALKTVVFGGEALDPASLRPWLDLYGDGSPRFWNLYGITETTVHVTLHEVTDAETQTAGRSPIGLPLPDLQAHLLDPRGRLVPTGVPGEIHVGGAGLARGYRRQRNRPDLTAERFIPDPFSGTPGSRLYRSGDLARRLADGSLEYLGRIDHQVKIRGYRIEPAEIEAALSRHPEVRAAAVESAGTAADRRLVAFVVPQDGEIPADALRAHLAGELPSYMVPSSFVALPGLPLTPNGKLDRRTLARLATEGAKPSSEATYIPPRTPAEEEIAALWAEILGVEKVGSLDSFFDLGGHSLLAARAAGRLRAAFHVEVPVRVIFDRPVLADLAAWVEQTLAEQAGGDELEALLAELEAMPADAEEEAEPRRG